MQDFRYRWSAGLRVGPPNIPTTVWTLTMRSLMEPSMPCKKTMPSRASHALASALVLDSWSPAPWLVLASMLTWDLRDVSKHAKEIGGNAWERGRGADATMTTRGMEILKIAFCKYLSCAFWVSP